jgi:hypothetical protein
LFDELTHPRSGVTVGAEIDLLHGEVADLAEQVV